MLGKCQMTLDELPRQYHYRILEEPQRKSRPMQLIITLNPLKKRIRNFSSDEVKDKEDQLQEQNEIMSQEDIEALITNSKSEKSSETPKNESPESNDSEEVLSKTDLKEMFEEQSSAVTKPETEIKRKSK